MEQTSAVVETVTENVAPAAAAASQGNGLWFTLLYCVAAFGIIYFLIVRPNKRRMAEYKKMQDAIKVGDRVMATGIYGTVKKINEKTFEVEIANGIVIEVTKNAVGTIE